MEWSEALGLMRRRVREVCKEVFTPEVAHGLRKLTMRSISIKAQPISINLPFCKPLPIFMPSVIVAVTDQTRALAEKGDLQAFEVLKQDILAKLEGGTDLSPRERQFVADL